MFCLAFQGQQGPRTLGDIFCRILASAKSPRLHHEQGDCETPEDKSQPMYGVLNGGSPAVLHRKNHMVMQDHDSSCG